MSSKQKRVPQRTCVICRQKFDKQQLIRLVRTPDGVFTDSTGKLNGRGAYVCDSEDCRQRLASTDILKRALRTSLNEDDRQRLRDVAQ